MIKTHYPKTKQELNEIVWKDTDKLDIESYDYWCTAECHSIDAHPAPKGQSKVIDRYGDVNLDPCRMILSDKSSRIQIEVPLNIYHDWMEDGEMQMGMK